MATINDTDFNVFRTYVINDDGTTLHGSDRYDLFCTLVEAAADLHDPGFDPKTDYVEYTRGQAELIAYAVGIGSDYRDIIIEAIQYRHDDIKRQTAEPEYTPLDRWFDSDAVQTALDVAKTAWESEQGNIGTDSISADEHVIVSVVNALTETVIASADLPLDVDSSASRQKVYTAILGAPTAKDALYRDYLADGSHDGTPLDFETWKRTNFLA